MAGRYDWARSLTERRWERPDPDDPRDVVLLLRQAADSLEQATARCLHGTAAAGSISGRVAVKPGRRGNRNGTAMLTDLYVLRRLSVRPSGVTQLAEYLGCSHTTTSRVLSRLESAGLVMRDVRLDDGRSSMAWPTDAGHHVIEQTNRVLDDGAGLVVQVVGTVEGIALRPLLAVLAGLADVY